MYNGLAVKATTVVSSFFLSLVPTRHSPERLLGYRRRQPRQCTGAHQGKSDHPKEPHSIQGTFKEQF